MDVERSLVDIGLYIGGGDGDGGDGITTRTSRAPKTKVSKTRRRKKRRLNKEGDIGDDDEAVTGNAKEDPFASVFMVDVMEMLRLKNFYDANVEIQACRQRKKIETFRHECTISWWFEQDQVQLNDKLHYFRDDRYMRLLHDMLLKAQDYLSLFNFVAFYYVRDMIGWVLADDGTLPFGVVELGLNKCETLGAFYSVRREGHFERELIYECSDETLNERYEFYVFDAGAAFEPTGQSYGGGIGGGSGGSAMVTPVSPFAELIDDMLEIREARVCRGDANFMGSHPESFLCSKPLPDTDIEKVPEATRYIEDDLASAALATSIHRANLSSVMAGGYINQWRQTARAMSSPAQDRAMVQQMYYQFGGGGGARQLGPDGKEIVPTIYHARQAEFGRPSVKETLEELPSFMEVSRGHPPTSLLDPTLLMQQFTDKVSQLMNFPYLLFKPQRGVGGDGHKSKGGAGGSALNSNGNRENAQKQLDDAVHEQQQTFQHIFEELYERTFGVMDQLLFAQLPPSYQALTDRISARMLFDNQVTKSDESIQALLPFYELGIVSRQNIQKLLVRNYGLLEDEEQEKRDDATNNDKGKKKKKSGAKKKEKNNTNDNDEDDNEELKSDKKKVEAEVKEKKKKEKKKEEKDKEEESDDNTPKSSKKKEKKKKEKDNEDEKGKKKRKADQIDK